MTSFTDNTKNPLSIVSSGTLNPFAGITVNDPNPLTDAETVTITLAPSGDSSLTNFNLGTITDPVTGVSSINGTFTEADLIGGNPSFATQLLKRLIYTAPELNDGQSAEAKAMISVTDSTPPPSPPPFPGPIRLLPTTFTLFGSTATDPTPVVIDTITPPGISLLLMGENDNNAAFKLFASSVITDNDFDQTAIDSATITVTDGNNSTPTDADGLLTPVFGLISKTGVGTYSLEDANPGTLTAALQSLVFTPIGTGLQTKFTVAVTDVAADLTNTGTVVVETPGVPPMISPILPNQTVMAGGTIALFAGVTIGDTNVNPSDQATITLNSDANGVLSGAGLSPTGASSTYTLAANSPKTFSSELDALIFTPNALPSGQTSVATTFTLSVADLDAGFPPPAPAIATTTVTEVAPPPVGPPVITGTGPVSVTTGSSVDPFAKTAITDPNSAAMVSATISLGASDANGALTGTGLSPDTGGVYTLAATDPASLTTELDNLVFTPSGQASATTTFSLTVTDTNDGQKAGPDNNTVVTTTPSVIPPAPPGVLPLGPPNNFLVSDQTTGGSWQSQGEPYVGPVAGLTSDIIIVTSDNLNVTAEIPNVFIKTGSGEDAIDVSKVNGSNIMDGSTGSNFLTGGTGDDTFYLDDRNAAQPIWSTLVNFHSGDNATIWGITAADFKLSWVDGEGAATAKGLTGTFTGAGTSTAVITLAGLTTADLTNGTLSISYGKTADLPGLPGSDYMLIHAN